MANVGDFIVLNPTPNMQRMAIDYACRSRYYTFDRMNYGSRAMRSRLIRIAAGIQTELCFEDYLRNARIQFDITGRTHWRLRDSAEFNIRNNRVDIKGYHVYPNEQRQFPDWIADAEGLVPVDQLNRANSPNIYIQAFFVSPQMNIGNEHLYVSLFPEGYSRRWTEARSFTVRNHAEETIYLEVGGETEEGVGISETVDCDQLQNIEVQEGRVHAAQNYSSLQYVLTQTLPKAEVSFSIDEGNTRTITPNDWIDLRLTDPTIYYAGWGTSSEYSEGEILPVGSKTRVYDGTRTRNYSVGINNLRPLRDLLI